MNAAPWASAGLRLRGLAGIALLLAAVAAQADVPRLKPLAPDAVVLAFGDSLTYGIGSPEMDYPRMVETRIGRRVINSGDNGETAGHGSRRLPAVLAQFKPALMILCLGLNDFLLGVPREQTRKDLATMIEAAQAQGTDVVLITVPLLRPSIVPDPMYAELGAQYGVVVEDSVLAEVMRDSLKKADLVHPNRDGYRHMAEGIVRLLRQRGAI
ncbi:MAG: GDSL-type esterase/lipase family protein [Panacagrimonas sp.]